jgi:type VI secretion system protein ImpJ
MKKIFWKEGLFLRPEHFQYQDLWWEQEFQGCFALKNPYAWGLTRLVLHRNLLANGQISIACLEGIMPDGTVFNLSGQEQKFTLRLQQTNASGFLCLLLPRYNSNGANIALEAGSSEPQRYLIQSVSAHDQLQAAHEEIQLEVLQPNFFLQYVPDIDNAMNSAIMMPLLHILEVRADGQIIIDAQFIAPTLWLEADAQLSAYLKEISGLLSLRRIKLLERLSGGASVGVAGMQELLLLQIINRYAPLLEHYQQHKQLHPLTLYQVFLQLMGELSTFTHKERSYVHPPLYLHENLQHTFITLLQDLRTAFNYVFDETAICIHFESYKHNLYVADLQKCSHFDYQRLVLAVQADMPLEQLCHLFPVQAKLGSTERIKELVALQVPGLPLTLLPVAPRQIPYHSGWVYFALEQHHELWPQLKKSGVLALHLSGEFPKITMLLWALRD